MTTLLLLWVAANLWVFLVQDGQHFQFSRTLFWPVLLITYWTVLILVIFINAVFDKDLEIW